MKDAVTVLSGFLDHIMHYRIEEAITLLSDDLTLHTSGSYTTALTIRGKSNVIRFYSPFSTLHSIDVMKQREPPEQVFTHMFGHSEWAAVRLEVRGQLNHDKRRIVPIFAHLANIEWDQGVECDKPRQKMQAIVHVIDEKIDEVWGMVYIPGERQTIIDAVNSANAEKERQRKKEENKRT